MKTTIEPRRFIVPPPRVLQSCHSDVYGLILQPCMESELILLHFVSSLAYQGCGTVSSTPCARTLFFIVFTLRAHPF